MQYLILNEGRGYVLYRKLEPLEAQWYKDECHRLRWYENFLWLRLEYSEDRNYLLKEVDRLSGSLLEI
ncbi:MAG: hypothetical protein ACI4LO_02635 [Anaerovoracaceae bacterium]